MKYYKSLFDLDTFSKISTMLRLTLPFDKGDGRYVHIYYLNHNRILLFYYF